MESASALNCLSSVYMKCSLARSWNWIPPAPFDKEAYLFLVFLRMLTLKWGLSKIRVKTHRANEINIERYQFGAERREWSRHERGK